MLTFFRRIRKRLLDSAQTRKYILYAIGEIVLIVIGILIALQINNWNEQRNNRDEEYLILKEIEENINSSMDELKILKRNANDHLNSINILINHISNSKPYHDSLNRHLYCIHCVYVPVFPSTGVENLKSKGLGLISDNNLRKQIIEMFDFRLKHISEGVGRVNQTMFEGFYNSQYMKHIRILYKELDDFVIDTFNINRTDVIAEPINYQALIRNDEFENWLRGYYDTYKYFKRIAEDNKPNVEELHDRIQLEILDKEK